MSSIKSEHNGFMKLGQLAQAKGAYGHVSGVTAENVFQDQGNYFSNVQLILHS